MSTLNMEEVDRLFDLFMPRIADAIVIENGSAEHTAAGTVTRRPKLHHGPSVK
jgi:hypothetical protein